MNDTEIKRIRMVLDQITRKFMEDGDFKRSPRGSLKIGHNPRRAPLAYTHHILAPLTENDIHRLKLSIEAEFLPPDPVIAFWKNWDGMFLFDAYMGIYGMIAWSDEEQPWDFVIPNYFERPKTLDREKFILASTGHALQFLTIDPAGAIEEFVKADLRPIGQWGSLADYFEDRVLGMYRAKLN